MTYIMHPSPASIIINNPVRQRILSYKMPDVRVCCENIAAAMFVTGKEMREGPS